MGKDFSIDSNVEVVNICKGKFVGMGTIKEHFTTNPIDVKKTMKELIMDDENLKRQLSMIMNTHGIDNECSTPDYILAEYLIDCLKSYKKIHNANRIWHGLPIEEDI